VRVGRRRPAYWESRQALKLGTRLQIGVGRPENEASSLARPFKRVECGCQDESIVVLKLVQAGKSVTKTSGMTV
jgi:hypothetical protein